MAALNLFPYRVAFVDAQGRLTPEAYRALMALSGRVGGAFGDQGEDVFAVFGQDSDGQLIQAETISQPVEISGDLADIAQPLSPDEQPLDMVFQPPVLGSAIQSVTPGPSPYPYQAQQEGALSVVGGTISAIALTRAGVTVSLAAATPMIPLSPGDAVTITYTVAPTLKFIPR